MKWLRLFPTVVDKDSINPAGFFGPVRPKGFGLLLDEAKQNQRSSSSRFHRSIIRVADDGNLIRGHDGGAGEVANLGTKEALKFVFPQLRMRNNGSDGGASDQARTYWGVRPKLDANSNQHDPDYCDYLRGLGMGLSEEGTHQTFNADSLNTLSSFLWMMCLDLQQLLVETSGLWDTVGAVAGSGASSYL